MNRSRLVPGRHCTLIVTGLLNCLSPLTGSAETYSTLPPPPGISSADSNTQQQEFMLGLVVNDDDRGLVVPVQFRDGHYLLRAADLQRAGIPTAQVTSSIMDVSAMDRVKAEYDRQRQRLLLTVPPEWLPAQTFAGTTHNGPRYEGRSSNGALFNYDLYASQTTGGGTRLSAWNELRLFGGYGQFSSNGIYQQQITGEAGALENGYIRYDTWWSNQNEDHALNLQVGDLISDSLAWSSSVRLGGIQVGRDFSLRPDLVTYPLPSFSGQAAVPSTVDLFVNGYKTSSNNVQPGPFSLTNMPFVNGAGNAVVITTDAQGRQVSTTLPFYVASDLLKSGLSDYSFSAGALRRNYGLKNFDYGAAASSGSYRYGLTDWLTLESHAEGAESLALGGAGVQLKLGAWGVVNSAVSQSQMEGENGRQYSWGYQYSTSRFSVGMQQTKRTADFGNLALYADHQDNSDTIEYNTLSRRSAQYNASVSLDRFGSLGAALIDITSGSGDRTRLLNLSYSRTLWGNSSLYISASRDQQSADWSGAIGVSIPFSDLSSASISVERNQQGGTAERLNFAHSMPTDGGFAWDASVANQSEGGNYRQGNLRWRNQKVETSAGFYGDDDFSTEYADISGSLVLMDGGAFAANKVDDAFVLVKTDYPDINVRFENQLMGKTDKQGYLLVPRVSSYYPAKYDIDTLDLPANMTTSSVEQRFSVKRQSGYLLHFPIEPLRAASVILHDQNGEPLPLSTQLTREGQQTEFVGWDGIAWLENLTVRNVIHAQTPDGRRCDTELTLSGGRPQSLTTYGPLICVLPPLPSRNTP
ncbi:fimbria/pilus outer membrane usher protein [Erwinia sorbitola]|uniref:Fimbria/pilus outer membrane usher protein n=1 Tax=Erwinia sorbitola TaxID=2681984 RepID=A0A6I6E955_9GAMM|nr:fimbria/pilus outer membrane usher protein [Erwinia sorbitola]QGU86267.1 fimbria/pilus outer membrane usher protein [Erwinia sorbitola]